MDYLPPTFQGVSVIFAVAAVLTGARAMVDPVSFSRSFGLPLRDTTARGKIEMSYVSLTGVRQLATGIILLIFAYQDKWTEMATILVILGVLVAGADGFYLSQAGESGRGKFHAIPGALIALLAAGFIYSTV